MKLKLLFAFVLGGSIMASAQGFKDAMEYFRAGEYDNAETIINRVIDDPATDRALADYYLGQIAFQRGDYAKAKSLFEQGLKAKGTVAYNYVGLGQIDLKNGNKAAAENNFKQAKAIEKKNAVLLTDIARAYYNVDPVRFKNDIDKAINDVKKVDKTCTPLYIFQADMLADQDNVGDAAGYYEMAMRSKDNVSYPEAFVKYARTYFKVNPEYSINGLKNLLELVPNSALAQRELAEKYYDNDQFTRAAEQYSKYIQNPNHFQIDEQRFVGLLYYGKKYEESNKWADIVLNSDPDNIFMKRMKFLNYAAMEDNANALKAADDFFGRDAQYTPNDYTTYGELLTKLGQDSLSVVQYENAVKVAPERLSLYSELSTAYANNDRFIDAAKAMQKYIDGGDFSTNDMLILARRYLNAAATAKEDSPERTEMANRAVDAITYVYEKVPDNYTVKSLRMRILLAQNGNKMNDVIADVMKDLLTTLDADPANLQNRKNDYKFIYNQLGSYYYDQKDNDNTRYYYNKFIEVDPTNPTNDKIIQFLEKLK